MLISVEVGWKPGTDTIRNAAHPVGKGFGEQFSSGCAFYAMRGELLEFRVVRGVGVSGRDEENFIAAGGIGELADVRDEFFGSGDIELAAREHEVALDVYFPEDEIARAHSLLYRWRWWKDDLEDRMRRRDAATTARGPPHELLHAQRGCYFFAVFVRFGYCGFFVHGEQLVVFHYCASAYDYGFHVVGFQRVG